MTVTLPPFPRGIKTGFNRFYSWAVVQLGKFIGRSESKHFAPASAGRSAETHRLTTKNGPPKMAEQKSKKHFFTRQTKRLEKTFQSRAKFSKERNKRSDDPGYTSGFLANFDVLPEPPKFLSFNMKSSDLSQ